MLPSLDRDPMINAGQRQNYHKNIYLSRVIMSTAAPSQSAAIHRIKNWTWSAPTSDCILTLALDAITVEKGIGVRRGVRGTVEISTQIFLRFLRGLRNPKPSKTL